MRDLCSSIKSLCIRCSATDCESVQQVVAIVEYATVCPLISPQSVFDMRFKRKTKDPQKLLHHGVFLIQQCVRCYRRICSRTSRPSNESVPLNCCTSCSTPHLIIFTPCAEDLHFSWWYKAQLVFVFYLNGLCMSISCFFQQSFSLNTLIYLDYWHLLFILFLFLKFFLV